MLTLTKNKFIGLTNNQLKIIAAISMVLDHVGVVFSPLYPTMAIFKLFRILGRIAFPIFAFLIAEGCKYTRNRVKYLGLIAGMGIAFQTFYFFFMSTNKLYLNIFITFSLSISLIYLIEHFLHNKTILNGIFMVIAIAIVLFLTLKCPKIEFLASRIYGFNVDYGIWGVTLPVLVYFINNHKLRIVFLTLFFVVRGFTAFLGWWPLISIPFIALYNGQRGKAKMKYFFYVFYPVHLVIIYAIAIIMQKLIQ